MENDQATTVSPAVKAEIEAILADPEKRVPFLKEMIKTIDDFEEWDKRETKKTADAEKSAKGIRAILRKLAGK